MAGASFRNLVAWQLAFALADDVRVAVLGLQLARACDSIGANIAEASGRRSAAVDGDCSAQARGSLTETEHWLLTAERRNLIDSRYDGRIAELGRTLNGLIRRRTKNALAS